MLVTGLGVDRPLGKLCAHVTGHRRGDPRGSQLLAGHPAGLDASPTAPGAGRPGGHHPPGIGRRVSAEGQTVSRGTMPYTLRKGAPRHPPVLTTQQLTAGPCLFSQNISGVVG